MSDPDIHASNGDVDIPGDDVETGTATGGASAFPGAPSAAPADDGDPETTTDDDGLPLDNPSGG